MTDELTLKENPHLKDFQDYIAKMIKVRGFDKETVPEIFMLLIEEVGEMAKAARKHTPIRIDRNSRQPELALETADVFVYLLDICNYFDIDLEQAFRAKEEINKKRIWNTAVQYENKN